MKIIIDCASTEQREAKVIEAFIKGLVPDADVQRSEYPLTHADRIRAMRRKSGLAHCGGSENR